MTEEKKLSEEELERLKAEGYVELPQIHEIDICEPRHWLARAWQDIRAKPQISLAYGAAYTLLSMGLIAALVYFDMERMIIPALSAFMLMGPVTAIGLYHVSRCIECAAPCSLGRVIRIRTMAPSQLMFIAALLLLIVLSWLRIAVTLYAFFFGMEDVQGDMSAIEAIFTTFNGILMLGIGTLTGAFLAVGVYMVTVFSIPLLMVRDCDALSAMIFSIRAVLKNFKVMMLWGLILTVLVGLGFVTGFLGFILIFPLTAHASWHAFRTVVQLPSGLDCEHKAEVLAEAAGQAGDNPSTGNQPSTAEEARG